MGLEREKGGKCLTSDFADVYIAVHNGVDGKCRYAFHAQLVHNVLAVCDNRC